MNLKLYPFRAHGMGNIIIHIEDSRDEGGALSIQVETAERVRVAAILAALKRALAEAGVR